MSENLILSHWNDAKEVFVPEHVFKTLCNYQIMGVRFLYNCFRKELSGAILNEEDGMNVQIQVASFFNALNLEITPDCPVLIVCSNESLKAWHYHLVHHGYFNVIYLSYSNYQDILDENNTECMFLTTFESLDLKLVREIKHLAFFSIVVDELDQVVNKNAIKQLKGQFNIGVTEQNFLKDRNQKMFWNILNWLNPGKNGKFAEFCIEDDEHLKNFRDPYPSWWLRLTWNYCETFKAKTLVELKEYTNALQKWSKQNSLTKGPEVKERRRKRLGEPLAYSTNENFDVFIPKSPRNVTNDSFGGIDDDNADDSQGTIIYDISEDETVKMEVVENKVEKEKSEDPMNVVLPTTQGIKMEVDETRDVLSMLYGDSVALNNLDDNKMSTLVSVTSETVKSEVDSA